jgi:hypothetical protein
MGMTRIWLGYVADMAGREIPVVSFKYSKKGKKEKEKKG